jgi:hypothetical protein
MSAPSDKPIVQPTPIDWAALPIVRTDLPTSEVMDRVRTASKRGRLPGFREIDGASFAVLAFGVPFDRELVIRVEASGGRTVLSACPVLLKRNPVLFAAVLIFTIWPGVAITKSMIPWEPFGIPFEAWYLPLTIIPTPFVWMGLMRKASRTTLASAIEAMSQIAGEVSGVVAGPEAKVG